MMLLSVVPHIFNVHLQIQGCVKATKTPGLVGILGIGLRTEVARHLDVISYLAAPGLSL
jgi:hypothetical protein